MSGADDRKPTPARGSLRASTSSEGDGEHGGAAPVDSHQPRVCVPCHGSGKVISNLGGHSAKVTCPWCRGSGERLTGMDAQEFQQEQVAAKRR
jgi:DnaJ-class molecular chaperone